MHNKKKVLRYGENPNQKAFLVEYNNKSIFDFQISGKKISYNNIIDIDSGIKCLNEFKDPTSVIVKHTNPCGVASAENINQAFKRCYECDPKSAFGGIIFLNRKVDLSLAKTIFKNFFEMIVATGFDKEALSLLKRKKNLILLRTPTVKRKTLESRSTMFGEIYQTKDMVPINKSFIKLTSNKKASVKLIDDLIFSLKVVKHLKSNAVVLSKDKKTLGLGHGQTNRIDALKVAITNRNINFGKKNVVCASDGFFPFTDGIKLLIKNKCNVFAQPSGSINDNNIISFANLHKISLYFIKHRLFKH